ncbi:MAG TPA: helix-turn-helix domain-containing protein [Cerasibacillus sp.]|uniref:helix-turn-helix domain-containing protein n=1 Tax=Cerasibacillus sp. TaxID=2498711 RepID=UPI002F3E5A79
MTVEQIAHNIKLLREQQNWSQQTLADKMHVSRSTITKWETNVGTPDIRSLVKLSHIFGITLDHLVGTDTFHNQLLKEFKRVYGSNTQSFDDEVAELIGYIMTHPEFKEQIIRLKKLPIQKQISIHRLIADLIDELEHV